MQYFLYLLAGLWMVYGFICLFFPYQEKKIINSSVYALPFWLWGVISFVVGLILWYSAGAVSFPLFVKVLAFLSGVKGLFFLFLPKPLITKMIDWWTGASQVVVRIYGAIAILLAYYLFSIIIF